MNKKDKDYDDAHEGFIRFNKHMPRSNDITLIILKGHLLVEQEMNEILDANLVESKALYDARITFSNYLAIIKSIYGSENSKFPYVQIEKLNALRNQLVHNLEPKNLEKYAEEFIQELDDSELKTEVSNMKLAIRLRATLTHLCGYIHGYTAGRSR